MLPPVRLIWINTLRCFSVKNLGMTENFPKGTGLNGAETHFLLSEASRLRRMSRELGDDPASLALRELADEYEAEVRSRQQPAPTLPEPYSGGPAGSGAGRRSKAAPP